MFPAVLIQPYESGQHGGNGKKEKKLIGNDSMGDNPEFQRSDQEKTGTDGRFLVMEKTLASVIKKVEGLGKYSDDTLQIIKYKIEHA